MVYTTKTTDEIKNNIVLNLISNVDEINDANVGSVLDLFTTSMAQELNEQYDDIEVVYRGTRITTAEGDDLEEIGLIVGVNRLQGVKSKGSVTFSRNTPVTAPFTIPQGTIVTTAPNTGETQSKFITTESKVFPVSIEDESQFYVNGIYLYKLNSRFLNSISELRAEISSVETVLDEGVDYEIVEGEINTLYDTTTLVSVDDCEATTDWVELNVDTDTITTNSSIYIQGSNGLNLIKDGVTLNEFGYEKDLGVGNDFDLSVNSLISHLYIEDSTALGKITSVDVYAASNSAFSNSYKIRTTKIVTGWNTIKLDRFDVNNIEIIGNPDYRNLRYIKIIINSPLITHTFSSGDLVMDFWFTSKHEKYEGTIIKFLLPTPDDNTDFHIDYTPLSVDINVEAQNPGENYNVTIKKVDYLESNISTINNVLNYSTISGGINIENDEGLRDRIRNASNIANVSTVDSIRYNILSLDFIQTCEVVDTPENIAINEAYIYNSTTKKVLLNKFVAKNTNTLKVSDTSGGSADYVKGTDYELTDYNELDFDLGGSEPTNGATIYIDYDYDKLGWFEVNVSGKLGQLTTTELLEVESVVDSKKAAGIKFEVFEPSYDVVSVDATITTSGTYTLSELENDIKDAIANYVNDLGIAENVLIAGIINVVMDIVGVSNISVTSLVSNEYPSNTGDLTIDSNHKASIDKVNITLT